MKIYVWRLLYSLTWYIAVLSCSLRDRCLDQRYSTIFYFLAENSARNIGLECYTWWKKIHFLQTPFLISHGGYKFDLETQYTISTQTLCSNTLNNRYSDKLIPNNQECSQIVLNNVSVRNILEWNDMNWKYFCQFSISKVATSWIKWNAYLSFTSIVTRVTELIYELVRASALDPLFDLYSKF